jgi:uncharacterized membrane protein
MRPDENGQPPGDKAMRKDIPVRKDIHVLTELETEQVSGGSQAGAGVGLVVGTVLGAIAGGAIGTVAGEYYGTQVGRHLF